MSSSASWPPPAHPSSSIRRDPLSANVLTLVATNASEAAAQQPTRMLQLFDQPWSHIAWFTLCPRGLIGLWDLAADPCVVCAVIVAVTSKAADVIEPLVDTAPASKNPELGSLWSALLQQGISALASESGWGSAVLFCVLFYLYRYWSRFGPMRHLHVRVRPQASAAGRYERVRIADSTGAGYTFSDYMLGVRDDDKQPHPATLHRPFLWQEKHAPAGTVRHCNQPLAFTFTAHSVPGRPATLLDYYPRIFQPYEAFSTNNALEQVQHGRLIMSMMVSKPWRRDRHWQESVEQTALGAPVHNVSFIRVRTYYSIVTALAYAVWYKIVFPCVWRSCRSDDLYVPPVVTGWVAAHFVLETCQTRAMGGTRLPSGLAEFVN